MGRGRCRNFPAAFRGDSKLAEVDYEEPSPIPAESKELRYVLELSGDKDALVKALGNVKNKIGDWHNWVELSAVARDTLSHRESCAVLKQIRSRTQKYLREGIAEANRMRMRYFHPRPTRTNPSARAIPTSESVWKAAAKLAA